MYEKTTQLNQRKTEHTIRKLKCLRKKSEVETSYEKHTHTQIIISAIKDIFPSAIIYARNHCDKLP